MFSKKIIVLKQTADGYSTGNKPACGICRLEKENAILTVYLSLIGFTALSHGEYRLYIVSDDKTVTDRVLGKIPNSLTFSEQTELRLDKGVSVGIWTVKDDLPLLIAYQKSDDAHLSAKDYATAVINSVIADKKLKEREKEFAIIPTPPQTLPTPQTPEPKLQPTENESSERVSATNVYNDEAVATANYYDLSDEIQQKLINIKKLSNEFVQDEENVNAYLNEQDAENGESRESTPYYLSVKSELDGLFDKYPTETTLENNFEGSRFVKVYYSEDKFYVVGLIKENGKEKYICYGVPSKYRETPPKELAEYCSFVPLSIFDLKGDGYFMMFQDAVTGKCVRKE